MSSKDIKYPKLIDIDRSIEKKDMYLIVLIVLTVFLLFCGSFSSTTLTVNAKFIQSESIKKIVAPFNGYIKILSFENGMIKAVFLRENFKENKIKIKQYKERLSLLLVEKSIYENRIKHIKSEEKYKVSLMKKNELLLKEKIKILNSLLKYYSESIKDYRKVLGVAMSYSDFHSFNEKKEKMKIDLLTDNQNLNEIESNIKDIKDNDFSDLNEKVSNVNLDIQDVKSKIEFLKFHMEGVKINIKNASYSFGRQKIRDHMYFEKGESIFSSKEKSKVSRIVAEINKNDFYQIDNTACAEVVYPIGYSLIKDDDNIICSFRKVVQVVYDNKKKEYDSKFYLESLFPENKFRGLLDGTSIKLKFKKKNIIKGRFF